MHTSSRETSNRSHIKSEFQMFSSISGGQVGVPQSGGPIWRLHTGTFRQITQERWTVQTCDLEKLVIW